MTTKYLKVVNEYGKVQLTDEASAYYFLYAKFKLKDMYINTSSNGKCTWSDGTTTEEAYNYCLYNDKQRLYVLRNGGNKEVRLAVAPMDFTGLPCFHVSCTGCNKDISDNIDVYVFARAAEFKQGNNGLQLFNSNGEILYDSSWKPLKIAKQLQDLEVIEDKITFQNKFGVILNSGYKQASEQNYAPGTYLVEADSKVWSSSPGNLVTGHVTPAILPLLNAGNVQYGATSTSYRNVGSVESLPVSIVYQGFVLSKDYLIAEKYTAISPTKSTFSYDVDSKAIYDWVDVEYQEWDSCATKYTEWDSCASESYEYNSTTGKWEYVCKAGLVQKCQAGLVTKTKKEYRQVGVEETTYTYETILSSVDNPSLMYGIEVYPDGTLFTRTSGLNTIGIVDLENY